MWQETEICQKLTSPLSEKYGQKNIELLLNFQKKLKLVLEYKAQLLGEIIISEFFCQELNSSQKLQRSENENIKTKTG